MSLIVELGLVVENRTMVLHGLHLPIGSAFTDVWCGEGAIGHGVFAYLSCFTVFLLEQNF